MIPNPRYELSEHFRELLEMLLTDAPSEQVCGRFDTDGWLYLYTGWVKGQRRLLVDTKHHRDDIAAFWKSKKEIVVYRDDFFGSPTVVGALYEVLRHTGDLFQGWKLTEYRNVRGTGQAETLDTGYTVEKFLSDVKLVREESVERRYWDGEEADNERVHEYRVLRTLQETRWFHATLRENADSIVTYGLQPSGLGPQRREGWSPGWNMGLQSAVYLTSSFRYAMGIGYTLAIRNGKDAAILGVSGVGLEDTKLLHYDEDALRSELDDSVLYGHYDTDFPQWVTSAEHRVRSIGYKAPIKPKYIKLLAVARYSQEIFYGGRVYREEEPTYPGEQPKIEPDVEWVGSSLLFDEDEDT